jgi:Copper amine oxidase, enzyme domain
MENAHWYTLLVSRSFTFVDLGPLRARCQYIAFSHREGIALSTITYNDDGVLRPLFYRLSLAEMVVPYSAPEHPHPRKFAFDVWVERTP